ncbi:MAG TPA: potassium transporter [Sulfurimonas sp.]|nr:potassium transporter [Sulfurimonas sp.]
MHDILIYGTVAMAISVILNLILKRFDIPQIIGYIMTGTILVYAFDLRHAVHSEVLHMIGEFGIVFLMFTIGLEMSIHKMKEMKRDVFFNGGLQVTLTAIFIYFICVSLFDISIKTSLIIALAFALSSTAVVLTYLKQSKEIYVPYGQRSMGILIFQDIAVIPILLLIGFLSSDGADLKVVLAETAVSAVVLLSGMFIIGKRAMTWILHFSANSRVEELFMGSVLVIVVGASLIANFAGFTYSLGAFMAGMIIAETKYHHKVESDIAPFKDLLLGAFFVTVGMKIDISYFFSHVTTIIALFFAVLLLKAILIFFIVRTGSLKSTAVKTALALSQVGEFSFAIFELASANSLLSSELSQVLVLIVVLSMFLTPFIMKGIHPLAEMFSKEELVENDFTGLTGRKDHVIVCGYSIIGKFVAKELKVRGIPHIIVDNSLKHVKEGLADNKEIYYGDMSKSSILHALHANDASSVIITLDNANKKRLISEAISKYEKPINLIVKVVNLEEKEMLKDLGIHALVDGKEEVAKILVSHSVQCQLNQI